MLVSGVRSSCEASATVALRLDHLLGLRAGGVELAKHLVERARELGDLVVGLGLGQAQRGSRVAAIPARRR